MLESVKGGYSIIVSKCGFYLRAVFNIFFIKTAAFIRGGLLLVGGFYSRQYGIKYSNHVVLECLLMPLPKVFLNSDDI